ncbi:MAG: PIN domain-containing protein [Bacteroidales bacterium]|nr:PIN domain-containing protein [Bacteroidales bacterium]
MRVYLDTNVLLDVLMNSREHHVDSATILRVAEKGALQAVLSTQSIIDASYVFSQKEKLPIAQFKNAIKLVLGIVTVTSISENSIKTAIRSDIADFEDAAQLDCAGEAECDVVISSDKKWKHYTDIPIYTPKEFCELIFDE